MRAESIQYGAPSSLGEPPFACSIAQSICTMSACGKRPEDALEILSMRPSQDELAEIISEQFEKIHQREMQKYVSLLG